MEGYVLTGIEDEYLLVIKSKDYELILQIIDRIAASRRKDFKEFALELEKSLNDDGRRRNSSETRSKNKTKNSTSNRSRCSKTANPKHRSKPSP
jgi:hypothetical protein